MKRRSAWITVGAALAAGACIGNPAPGNDREAELDPPAPPAEMAPVETALAGVDVSLLHPQIITGPDRTAVPEQPGRCAFRFTTVGFPVFLYSRSPGTAGVLKLNGKLLSLEGGADGRFASGGVSVDLRPLDTEARAEGRHPSELILRLPGAPHELGYRGFSECGAGAGDER